MLTPEYSAGFFDGEGSVYPATRRRAHSPNTSPTILVCISNTNLDVLEAHKKTWGGSICERKITRPNRQRQWQWVICTKNASVYLSAIYPHLVVKKAVVGLAIEFLELRLRPRHERIDYSGVVERRGRKWSQPVVRPEHKAAISELFYAIRACNTRAAPKNSRRAYDA